MSNNKNRNDVEKQQELCREIARGGTSLRSKNGVEEKWC
jgi:hypothetical protein